MSQNYKIEFYGRRRLGTSRKRLYITLGVIGLAIGLFGLFNANPASGFFLLSFALLVSGIGNIGFALIDRRLVKEHNYLQILEDKVEFKNSHQKSHSFKRNMLDDVIIQGHKAEFRLNNQTVFIYDFSGYPWSVVNEIVLVLKPLSRRRQSGANSMEA